MKIQIYNTAKAIIFNADQVLLIKKEYEDGLVIFSLPGGSQDPGESLHETLARELEEEIAASVKIIDLVRVYEYRKLSKSDPDLIKHKVEFAFLCRVESSYKPELGSHPDPHQTDVMWVNRKEISGLNIYPAFLKDVLSQHEFPATPIYQTQQ